MGVTANGDGVSLWGDENGLELDRGDGCTKYTELPLNCSLSNGQFYIMWISY